MKKIRLIMPVALLITLIASFAYAEEEVIIDAAYTTNEYMDEETTEFCVWDPVVFNVDYTITGEARKTYKAIIVIRYKGERLRTVERHKPGSYTTTLINVAAGEDIGDPRNVTYKIKLKHRGVLVDISDPVKSEITVSECSP